MTPIRIEFYIDDVLYQAENLNLKSDFMFHDMPTMFEHNKRLFKLSHVSLTPNTHGHHIVYKKIDDRNKPVAVLDWIHSLDADPMDPNYF
jgi:hypothetical protein